MFRHSPALKGKLAAVKSRDSNNTAMHLIEAKRVLDEAGVVIESAIVIVDRKEGAKENLAEIGVPLESIFTIHDFEG